MTQEQANHFFNDEAAVMSGEIMGLVNDNDEAFKALLKYFGIEDESRGELSVMLAYCSTLERHWALSIATEIVKASKEESVYA